jgi:hypothetical protein
MARPKGSENKDKPFRDALRMEIAAAQDEEDFRSLRAIARGLLKAGAAGDVPAIREIADRMDGKVTQTIGGDEESGPIQITWLKS